MKPTRTIGIVLAIMGIALLLIGLTAPLFVQETAATPSVGIIGGADGPTYLLTLKAAAGGLFLWMAIAGAVMMIASVVLLIAGRRKN